MDNGTNELTKKMLKLQWMLHRRHMVRHAKYGPLADTSRGQGRVLAALKAQPEISTKELSYLLDIRIPSLNELLNKLEKGGYILRKPSDADRRVMIIHLTQKGKETPQPDNKPTALFDCLTEPEKETLGIYLDKIIESLHSDTEFSMTEEEMADWMQKSRERMGEERFRQFVEMRHKAEMGHGGGFGWPGSDVCPGPDHCPGEYGEDPDSKRENPKKQEKNTENK